MVKKEEDTCVLQTRSDRERGKIRVKLITGLVRKEGEGFWGNGGNEKNVEIERERERRF